MRFPELIDCCHRCSHHENRVSVRHLTALETVEDVPCDMLLVATGRTPHTHSLQLGNVGVRVGTHGGVVVSDTLQVRHDHDHHDGQNLLTGVGDVQTSLAHVFAAGDCIDGGEQFTHLAGKHGFVAARNAMFWGAFSGAIAVLPRCTYTTPEVASVGLTMDEALRTYGEKVTVYTRQNSHIDRSRCDGDLDGFVSLAVLSDGRIAGATVVGARAGEVISEVVLAMTHRMRVSDIALAVHPYPSYSVSLQQVAAEAAAALFRASTVGKVVDSLYAGSRRVKAGSGVALASSAAAAAAGSAPPMDAEARAELTAASAAVIG